jgi:hypothetical protein
VIYRVLRYLNHQRFVSHDSLTGQTRLGLETPGFIEIVLFELIGLRHRLESLSHDDMACCTGTGHLTGMFDIDIMLK